MQVYILQSVHLHVHLVMEYGSDVLCHLLLLVSMLLPDCARPIHEQQAGPIHSR